MTAQRFSDSNEKFARRRLTDFDSTVREFDGKDVVDRRDDIMRSDMRNLVRRMRSTYLLLTSAQSSSRAVKNVRRWSRHH